MGRATSEKVGRGICPQIGCGEPVFYRKSAGGMLTYKCENCDSSGYAEPGGEAFKARMASLQNSNPTAYPGKLSTVAAAVIELTESPPAAKRAAFSLAAL